VPLATSFFIMTKGLKDILHFLETNRSLIQHRFGVTKLGVFGSYNRGEQGPDSDIDMIVEIDAPDYFDTFYDLKNFLEVGLGVRVDMGAVGTFKSHMRVEMVWVWV